MSKYKQIPGLSVDEETGIYYDTNGRAFQPADSNISAYDALVLRQQEAEEELDEELGDKIKLVDSFTSLELRLVLKTLMTYSWSDDIEDDIWNVSDIIRAEAD